MASNEVYLPLRLEDWENEKTVNSATFPGSAINAESVTVENTEGAPVFAIEDGVVEENEAGSLTLQGQDVDWTYTGVELTISEGKVGAGQRIGRVLPEKDFTFMARSEDAQLDGIMIPQNPLPILEDLGVTALPQDADLVTSASDSPEELTSFGFGRGMDKTTRYAMYAGGAVLGGLILYKLWKK